MNRDATYRYYNCNIQTPKLKCNEIATSTLSTTTVNGLAFEGGFKPYANSFDISPTSLQQPTIAGELTCYVTNEGIGSAGVFMIGIFKSIGTLSVVPYQIIGKYGGTTITAFSSTTVRVTLPTGMYGTCKWHYKGI